MQNWLLSIHLSLIFLFSLFSVALLPVCCINYREHLLSQYDKQRNSANHVSASQKSNQLLYWWENEKRVVNKTIVEGLRPYALGEKLRSLRLRKSMGLVELGKHTGLSAAMLSKLERGKLFPTLPTLLRIALVFGVGLEYFFTDERKRHVVAIARKKERLRFPDSPGGGSIAYNFESLDFNATERKLNAFYAEFEPISSEKAKPHQHPGVELLYLISGKLDLTIGSETFNLESGDAVYFDSGVRHSYHRAGKSPCTGVIVTA
jgi:transcriptional regulator with XRE-family HTH domain